ncbi:serine hydrolase [Kribbella sp.]|uniref:serine hydrolase domain-containing protein n=1 Tax=Kribbella sp. TaxID=1871183 RepID=UPI002D5E623C|nr:serine hydrolase [Kribbella sp.]HZX05858.1 serine hydrolase [Kribbella sp.]
MSQLPLLPRASPSTAGIHAAGVSALLDRLEEETIECHSLMVVRHGQVVAEGWWAPYSADRPHQLYSLTKSFVSLAVGIAVDDGRMNLEDRVVDVLADHAPESVPARVKELTVHHLLSMSTGHSEDVLEAAWTLEPQDLVRGFLRIAPDMQVGSRHAYSNPTSFVLARMVERVTGQGLPEFLAQRLFRPMGISGAEWDRVGNGLTFGFHGLYLTTEAVAAVGQLLLQGGRWRDRQLVSQQWVELASRQHVETLQFEDNSRAPDWLEGYGYHFWRSRYGYRGDGAMGQLCLVLPDVDVVVAITAATPRMQGLLDAVWDCLLPSLNQHGSPEDDLVLADRLGRLALPMTTGEHRPQTSAGGVVDAWTEGSALPPGSSITIEPRPRGWSLRITTEGAALDIAVGNGQWQESAPLGRPVVAVGGWDGDVFLADLFVITSPSRVRIAVDKSRATASWNIVPLVGPNLLHQLRSGLITRPDRS